MNLPLNQATRELVSSIVVISAILTDECPAASDGVCEKQRQAKTPLLTGLFATIPLPYTDHPGVFSSGMWKPYLLTPEIARRWCHYVAPSAIRSRFSSTRLEAPCRAVRIIARPSSSEVM